MEGLLSKADIVKVDFEELNLITGFWTDYREVLSQVGFLKNKFGLEMLIVTKGAEGAACSDENGYFEHPGFPVNVTDTIGCGDAFLAAFLSKMLTGKKTAACLHFACAVGALLATKAGGTPTLTKSDVQSILNQ